jgi:pantoate--beta-alanine ligase
MQVFTTIEDIKSYCKDLTPLGFIPTMGALHDGHLALVREAKRLAQSVVVSIFVNPLQFGANEDFSRYPRTLQEDIDKLTPLADMVFAPEYHTLYPKPQSIFIEPPALANELCGKFRPDHFKGVLTVVAKLLHIVEPDLAFFGKKDYQQFVLVKEMVQQLNMPTTIYGVETIREEDGLAKSSRNRYLSSGERSIAPKLYVVLDHIAKAIETGERNYEALCRQGVAELSALGFIIDYIEVREAEDLAPMKEETNRFVVLGAATLGKTRLIDNVEGCRA